jgi:uncharacterized RmlC-like cupin family protein
MTQPKPLKTRQMTPEEMESRIARFAGLQPQATYYDKDAGIPAAAYETVAARKLFTLMAPSTKAGPMSARPAIVSDDKLSVIIAECPPGNKPMLHAHFFTVEHFMCLSGRFRIRWGDHGEHETFLEPYDMIAVPPAVCRDFTNVSDRTAHLLVLITGSKPEDYNDIGFTPEESARFQAQFGPEVVGKFESIGFTFMKDDAS